MNSVSSSPRVAYFSMEIALDPAVPTYAGGLGVLSGDTLRSAADRGVPVVGVTLIHRKGYFQQRLDERGTQTEEVPVWAPQQILEPTTAVASVTLEGRRVFVRAWKYPLVGLSGHVVPVYLLNTSLAENSPEDRTLTDHLYGGDERYRLCQEVILGIGGVEVLRELGHADIATYHMNEGHSALLALALLEQQLEREGPGFPMDSAVDAVRRRCIFTTHTPVPAAQDQFSRELTLQVLGKNRAALLDATESYPDHLLNMTYVGLRFSHYINGVAMHHGEVSQGMFPRYPIRAITNGVHAVTWTAPSFQELYDRHFPEWRRDNLYLRYGIGIPVAEIREAHLRAKRALLAAIKKNAGLQFDERVLTIGFARRATLYKRADLLFSNRERLRWIAEHVGPLQLVFAGKAHPRDTQGKELIRRVFEAAASLGDGIKFVYLPDYDMRWAKLLTSGSDVWLNTPQKPNEASGTSGMKAALNGVPSLSVLDGWWLEGCVEGATGWAIGSAGDTSQNPDGEAASLYDKLERVILPAFYGHPDSFAEIRRSAIALNGSFFNSQRMVFQYVANAYFPHEHGQYGALGSGGEKHVQRVLL
jgi:starch phosphorylase